MGDMPAVFVHGVPRTPAVWRGLLATLDRPDTVALSLPGFDSARPAGFGATMEEYADWLAARLEAPGGPGGVGGDDWGGVGRSGRARLGRRVRGPGGLNPARSGPVLGHRCRGHRRRRVRVARLRQD